MPVLLPHIIFDNFVALRKEWGDDAAIQAIDAMGKKGRWRFTLWHGSRCFGIRKTPADTAAAAKTYPVTHLRSSVDFTVPWTPNPISIGRMMNIQRWLTEHRQLKDIGERHENPVYHAWYCSLFEQAKEVAPAASR